MEENHLSSELKARALDLEKQLEENHELLKAATGEVKKLRETISVQEQAINERNNTIVSIQNLEAWHEGACEGVGVQLNWQEGWKKLWTAYSDQAKLLKALQQDGKSKEISKQFADFRDTISALRETIAQNDEIIARMDLTIKNKDRTITEKDLLLSGADPNAFPLYADIKVACLGDLSYQKDRVFADIDLTSSVMEVQVDIKGRTINECVIRFLIDELTRLHKNYDDINAACQKQMVMESLKKPLYEIGLKVRAREMEKSIASRTNSVPREKITGPGNHAAHGADAFADAQMVLETDSETGAGRVNSGKREQFKLTYLVPPETVLKLGSVWNDSYFPKFIELLNLHQDLKIWCDDGIGVLEFATRRYRIAHLINKVYPLKELYNAKTFDANEAAIKEFNELWDICRELRDEHRKYCEIPKADREKLMIDFTQGFYNLSLVPEDKKEKVARRLEEVFNIKESTMNVMDKHLNTAKLPTNIDGFDSYTAPSTTSTIISMNQGGDEMVLVEYQRRGTKVTHQARDAIIEPLSGQKNHHIEGITEHSTKAILDKSKETELETARKNFREEDKIIQKQNTKLAQLLEWKNKKSLPVKNIEQNHAESLQTKNMEIASLQTSLIADRASLDRKHESLIEIAVQILGRKKELSKPSNLRNSALIQEGNSAAHGGRCLADLERMEIKPMDGDSDWFAKGYGVTVKGARRFKGSLAFRKLINMRFDLLHLEYIDQQIIIEFETAFQKIKMQIKESLPAEGETNEDDAYIMEKLLLNDSVVKILFQEACCNWVAAVDRDQTTRKGLRKDPKAMSFGRGSYQSGGKNRSRWNKGSSIIGTISKGVKSTMEKIL